MYSHIKIGKIVATFGLTGDIIIEHNLGKKSAFKNIEVVFIEQTKNALLPFFVKTGKIKSDTETQILFDDIKSKEDAKRLVGKPVWLTNEDFDKLVEKKSPFALLGYDVYNDDEFIGKVIEVIEQPHQILLTIIHKEKEVYIPLHEESLIKIDNKKRFVIVDLPEGLLEIYL